MRNWSDQTDGRSGPIPAIKQTNTAQTNTEQTNTAQTGGRTERGLAGTRLPAPVAMAAGALCVSFSAILIELAHTTPGTASFYRCALALPLLVGLALAERRRGGGLTGGQWIAVVVAGAMFAGDMLLWTQAILEVGAGLSTVLVNAQIMIVPLLAWSVDHERIARRFVLSLPVMLAGMLLVGGVLENGVPGSDPTWGTVHAVLAAVCYSMLLFLLRRVGQDRVGQAKAGGTPEHQRGRAVQAYCGVIAVSAVVSLVAGALWHGVSMAPGWAAIGWLALVAVVGQVVGWLLVALAAPRLPSEVGAALLMLTPIGALVLGAVVLGERPSVLQLVGSVLILASAYAASSRSNPVALIRRWTHSPAAG
ncbi:DMT family transporter [Rugosimonospora africana]|uniref:DMT family transporter n=1 Tax=Rugosimonospora africana TaxID=556532 RepID=UPI001941CC00|nr:DMT family transporter [Rugosimonospora africana]